MVDKTIKDIEKDQSEKLIKLVNYIYKNCAPYSEKMKLANVSPSDIKSIKDISKLPFTTKQDLRDNYPFGMFSANSDDIVRVHASSGTTGKLTVVGYTEEDIKNWTLVTKRCLERLGVNKKSIVHNAFGYGLFTGGLGIHYACESIGCMTVPVSGGNTERQIMLLKDFKADVLFSTPSYAIYLYETMEKLNMKPSDLNLKIGIFGAEPWSEQMRTRIEKAFNIKAYDIYGLSEITGPGVSCECIEQDGLHINEDHYYAEIVDKDTLEPLDYGKEGELVFTTLTKQGIPLIRYRTRDLCKLKRGECSCGSCFCKMDRVKGRSDDMMIIRGVNVFPSHIESALLRCSNDITTNYQLILTRHNSLDHLEVVVELNSQYQVDKVKDIQDLQQKIRHEVMSYAGISCTVTLVSHNTLPRSEGKAVRIIDKREM